MSQIINIIAYSMTFIIVISLLTYIARLRKIISKSLESVLELTIKENILMDELDKALKKIEEKPIESSDGFIKFMTDSREAAFAFIS